MRSDAFGRPGGHRTPRIAGAEGVDILWIPVGAGGWFVRSNGRAYERVVAWRDHREAADLYHTALKVRTPEGRFVVENAWPIPDARGAARGVVSEGPVFSERLGRRRAFRYEIRRWKDGIISDERWAQATTHATGDVHTARRLLDLVPDVPTHTWGRRVREAATREMWNSNSVVSWLLASAGIEVARLRPPSGGRAPGWRVGAELAA